MVIIITSDVVLRYVFNSPIVWSQEVNGILLFIFLFACQAFCWDQDQHIRMDIFYSNFNWRVKAGSNILTGLAGICFFGVMGVQGIRDIPYMLATHETTDELRIVLWPFKAFMVFCCFLIVALLIIYLSKSCKKPQDGEEKQWN